MFQFQSNWNCHVLLWACKMVQSLLEHSLVVFYKFKYILNIATQWSYSYVFTQEKERRKTIKRE